MYVCMVWYGMVWYGMYVCMVSMHKSIKGGFGRIWMTDRAPYHIVFLVYLVDVTTGRIGGNASIRDDVTTGSIGGNGRIRLLQNSVEYGFVCIGGIWSSGHESDTPTAEGSADSHTWACCRLAAASFISVAVDNGNAAPCSHRSRWP